MGIKLSLGRREWWGASVLRFVLLPIILFFVNESNPFPQVESGFPTTVMGEGSLPALSELQSLSLSFLSSVQLRKAVLERLWWVPGIQPGKTDHTTPFSSNTLASEGL